MGDVLDKKGIGKLWEKIKEYVEKHPPVNITGNAGTASKLANAHAVNGLLFDGSADRAGYAVCSTAGATAAKTAYIAGFSLVKGAEAVIRFSSSNTAANPTLNVSSTGAKFIYYGGAHIPAGYIREGSVIAFRYSGSYWYAVGELTQAQIDAISQKVKNTSLLSLGTANGVTAQYKYNSMMASVYVTGSFSGTLAGWGTLSLGTLPAAARPPRKVYVRAIDNFAVEISTTGEVQVRNASNSSVTFSGYSVEATVSYLL